MNTYDFIGELNELCKKFCGDPMDKQQTVRKRMVVTQTTVTSEIWADVERDADAAFRQLFGCF